MTNETILIVILNVWLLLFGQMQILWSWYKLVSKQAKREAAMSGFHPKDFDWTTGSRSLKINATAFVIFDWWVNLTTISIRFLQLPHSLTQVVTTRMKKWRRDYEGMKPSELSLIEWNRRLFAINLCDDLLDEFDLDGDHC